MNSEARILEPGQLEAPAGEIPFLRLPDIRTVFSRRATRFRHLAQGHPLGGFLTLLGALSDAQQAELDMFPEVPLPSADALDLARQHGLPPLGVHMWQRDPAWRNTYTGLLRRLENYVLPDDTRRLLDELTYPDADWLEHQADLLLNSEYASQDARMTPFVAAALQTYWVHMVQSLGAAAFDRIESASLCPACGQRPVASVLYGGGVDTGLRYLHCSLCATEWHMVRAKCSNCESTKGISYFELEGGNGAIKAEACDACNTYLKVLYLARDFESEPCADDCASLGLDILLDESGKQRSGPNLYLHPGSL